MTVDSSTASAQRDGAGEEESWREHLSLRLSRGFCVTFTLAVPLMLVGLEGALVRGTFVSLAALSALVFAIPSLTGRPSGRARAWLIIGLCLSASFCSLLLNGFLSAPGAILTLTLMLAGLLLGQRTMLLVGLGSVLGVAGVAWATVTGRVATAAPINSSLTNPWAWLRTMGVTFLAAGMIATVMLAVIHRIERSLELARLETLRREKAERERAEAERRALEAEQLETVGRLAAGIAHDFNNNLTAIIGCAELLRLEYAEGSQGQELARDILQASRRAAELTGQLLAYSRKAQMLLEPINVHSLIESASSLLRRSMNPAIVFSTRLDATLPTVEADPSLLQNALLNLMVNACDAMPEGGTLEVTTSDWKSSEAGAPPRILVEVRDTGAGIDAADLPRIFDPFFTTKPVGQGTGLGLAAVAGTIESLGGRVTVESQLGQGSVFRLILPQSDSPEFPDEPDTITPASSEGEILLVDDEPLVRRAAKATLYALGYEVVAVASGAEALDLVRTAPARFDLVLLDLRMPHLSGEATFEALMRLNPELRVLIWSGYGAEQDLPEMLRRGAVGFVQKPYSVSELSQVVARVIRRRPPRQPS